MKNRKKALTLFIFIGIITFIISGCTDGEPQSTKPNGEVNEVSTEDVKNTNEGESENIEQAQDEEDLAVEEPKPSLLHINTFEHMGGVPIPFESVRDLEQHGDDIYLYSAEGGGMFENGTLYYSILQDKQTYMEPGAVPDKDKVKGYIGNKVYGHSDKGKMLNLFTINADGESAWEQFDLSNIGVYLPSYNRVKNSSEGEVILYLNNSDQGGEGKSGIQILKLSSPTDIIEVPGNGYKVTEGDYDIHYVDFFNNRIITFDENTVSGITESSIQLFDLNTGEPMWDEEGQRLTVSLNDLYDPVFHVDKDGILTVASFGINSEKHMLKVIQFDKDLNQIFYEIAPIVIDGEEKPVIKFTDDGTINIYDFPLFKEKMYLNLTQMKIGIPEF